MLSVLLFIAFSAAWLGWFVFSFAFPAKGQVFANLSNAEFMFCVDLALSVPLLLLCTDFVPSKLKGWFHWYDEEKSFNAVATLTAMFPGFNFFVLLLGGVGFIAAPFIEKAGKILAAIERIPM